MKSRLILILLAMLCLLGGCAAPESTAVDDKYDELIVVGFSQVGAESDWRNANTRSMQQALSAENGFRLIIDDAQQKKERQITAIRNFIHQGVDYIVLAPTTEDGWETVLGEAKAAGIPVIIIDRMIDRIFPVMQQRGGFLPTCDHGVPEEVSLENYLYFRRRCLEFA